MTPLDPTLLKEARSSRDRLLELQRDLEKARADYNHAVRRLHAGGGSLREIAEDLGLSHQRVHQIVDSGDETASPPVQRRRSPWPFPHERFTRRARRAVALAQEEADELGHGRVGTEHMLLGVLKAEDEATATVLENAGVSFARARELVGGLEVRPRGRGRMPFTRAAKRSLALSLHAARDLGDTYIGTEHVLLGLVADERAGAVEIVRELGADPDAIRTAVLDRRTAA
jgi:ATP-dependent Clp protease ATP-binding subunit ClpA